MGPSAVVAGFFSDCVLCKPWLIVFADELFLGHDLLAWLVLAFGGALVFGNIAALVRPPTESGGAMDATGLRRRAVLFAVIGAIAAIWALATLLTR